MLAAVVDEVAGDLDSFEADDLHTMPLAVYEGSVQASDHRLSYVRNLESNDIRGCEGCCLVYIYIHNFKCFLK